MSENEWLELLDVALARGWRVEAIIKVLQGPARYGDGSVVPCCESCGKLENVDGLITTEIISDPKWPLDPPVVGGMVCPACRVRVARGDA